MEEVMLDLMYELPDHDNSSVRYMIDRETVYGRKSLDELRQRSAQKKESA